MTMSKAEGGRRGAALGRPLGLPPLPLRKRLPAGGGPPPGPAMPPQIDRVEVRGCPHLEHEYQFVFRAIERAHSRVALVPDAQVQELAVDVSPDRGAIVHMPPIHADEVDSAVSGYLRGSPQTT